jgi:Kef-type K+ transport system membrane component KefB
VEPVQFAAILAAVILVASIVSVELGLTVALFELGLGIFLGNTFDLGSQEWLDFLAAFAAIVLTFLAGAEVDPRDFRDRFGARSRSVSCRSPVHSPLPRRRPTGSSTGRSRRR